LFDLSKVSLLWFYVVSHVRNEEDVDLVVKCLLFGLALQGAIGVYQAYFGFPEWATPIAKGDPTTLGRLDTRGFLRVGGTIGWTTVFAQYLILLILVTGETGEFHVPEVRSLLGLASVDPALVLRSPVQDGFGYRRLCNHRFLFWYSGPVSVTLILGVYQSWFSSAVSFDEGTVLFRGLRFSRANPHDPVAWDIIQQNPFWA
jgi:hypothetical protein